jgi:hypothetical protein
MQDGSDRTRRRGAVALRVATLGLGAALAVSAGVWLAQALSLRDVEVRVSQGPHLYVRGRNYPGPVIAPSTGGLQEAVTPRAEEAADGTRPEAS